MTKAKIMIVEDEALLAADLRYQLEAFGYTVTGIAASSEKALRKINDDIPDLVLMDVQLKGGVDGIDTADKIRSRHGIPVVYLTAYADEEFLERAKITEPYGYMLKPAESREIHTTIALALYKAKMEKERVKLVAELKDAMENIKTLSGLLPICANCKNIRDDKGYWNNLETYIEKHSNASFSHGMCQQCSDAIYGDEDWYIEMKNKKSKNGG